MDSWDSRLIPGTVLSRSGTYAVAHTCTRPPHTTYLFEGAILPSCPDCVAIYRLIAEEEPERGKATSV